MHHPPPCLRPTPIPPRIETCAPLAGRGRLGVALLVGMFSLVLAADTRAGGGPENVLVVVNSESPASMAIANQYAALRRIPANNMLYLAWDPKADTTDINTFRQKILTPVLSAIGRGHAPGQIDCVAYSADFPWSVQLDADVKRLEATLQKEASEFAAKDSKDEKGPGEKPAKKPPAVEQVIAGFKPVGSLTGLTYLWEGVMTGDPRAYANWRTNWYFRRPAAGEKAPASLAFKFADSFGPTGEVQKPGIQGRRYLLSVMLGVTAGRGNTPAEVLAYLHRNVRADGSKPGGNIYFMKNGDVRSRTRQPLFPAAVEELKLLGVGAEILDGEMPKDKKDVQGAMLGSASFDWKSSHSTILPGAICEHFTSYGGIMTANYGQTPLSEFLRYGAAGASGTVTEPYAIAEKFPTAMLQVHYARGCTLAEAFYQSVAGPYQLLIVGDPLCRPWANIPEVTVAGVKPGDHVQGALRLQPAAKMPGQATVDHFELSVDGVKLAACKTTGAFDLDTAILIDGYHELRVTAIEAGSIQSQGTAVIPITTANHGRKISLAVSPRNGALRFGQTLSITAEAPGCITIGIAQGTRWVGKIAGSKGEVEIGAARLGLGPVRLQVMGVGDGQVKSNALSAPIELMVEGE